MSGGRQASCPLPSVPLQVALPVKGRHWSRAPSMCVSLIFSPHCSSKLHLPFGLILSVALETTQDKLEMQLCRADLESTCPGSYTTPQPRERGGQSPSG